MASLYRVIVPTQPAQVFDAIDESIAAKRLLPALILCYAVMDITASLQRKAGEGTRAAFERWINKYVLPREDILCSGTDLYAARCGILHTLTSRKRTLIDQGSAKKNCLRMGCC